MKKINMVILCVLICTNLIAETKTWENVYCSVSKGQTYSNHIAIDFALGDSSYIYALGVGEYDHDGIYDKDLIILKIDSVGNLISEIVITYDSNSIDKPLAIRYNKVNGQIYLVSNSTLNDSVKFSMLYCLDANLNQVYSDLITIDSATSVFSSWIAIDDSGNTIITGDYDHKDIGKSVFICKITLGNIMTIATYNNGDSNADESASKVVFDSFNNIFVLAYQNNQIKAREWVVLKFNNQLNLVKQLNFNYKSSLFLDDTPTDIVIAPNNEIYITGTCAYSTANSKTKSVTVKYSSNFKKLWLNVYSGSPISRQICYSDSAIFISCDNYKLIALSPLDGSLKRELISNGNRINDFKLNAMHEVITVGTSDSIYKKNSTSQGYLVRWDTSGYKAYEKNLPANFVNRVGFASEYLKVITVSNGFYVLSKRYNSSIFSGYCMKVQFFQYDTLITFKVNAKKQKDDLKVLPNPVSKTATIQFSNKQDEFIEIVVINLLGKKIRTIKNEFLISGEYSLSWDLKADSGSEVANGVYLIRFDSPAGSITQKVVIGR